MKPILVSLFLLPCWLFIFILCWHVKGAANNLMLNLIEGNSFWLVAYHTIDNVFALIFINMIIQVTLLKYVSCQTKSGLAFKYTWWLIVLIALVSEVLVFVMTWAIYYLFFLDINVEVPWKWWLPPMIWKKMKCSTS